MPTNEPRESSTVATAQNVKRFLRQLIGNAPQVTIPAMPVPAQGDPSPLKAPHCIPADTGPTARLNVQLHVTPLDKNLLPLGPTLLAEAREVSPHLVVMLVPWRAPSLYLMLEASGAQPALQVVVEIASSRPLTPDLHEVIGRFVPWRE